MAHADHHALTRVLARGVPGGSRAKGRVYHLEGAVTRLDGTAWDVHALVRGTRPYAVAIHRDPSVEFRASCDCPYFHDRFVICKHIWAALLEAERRGHLLGDGAVPEDARLEPVDPADESDPEFRPPRPVPRAGRPGKRPRPWEQFLAEVSRSLAQAEAGTALPRFAGAQIVYVIDRAATIAGDALALDLQARQVKKNGEWGRPKAITVSPADIAHLSEPLDREIVPLLIGAGDPYGGAYMSYVARASFRLTSPLLDRVLPLMAQSGRLFLRVQPPPGEQLVPLTFDEGLPWTFHLEIVHASGDEGFSIDGALVRGRERLAIREPWMVLPSGYIVHGGRLARLDARGAFAWLAQLRGSGPLVIPPGATGQLLDVLARSGVDPAHLPEELQFEIVAETPRPRLSVRSDARSAVTTSLQATVTFDYGGHLVEPEARATTFDPARRKLIRRDLALEQGALAQLTPLGFARSWDYAYSRQHFAISAARFPAAVRALVEQGWHVEAEGRAFRSVESMRSEVRSGIDWFELHGSVDFGGGGSVPLPRLLDAFRKGSTTVALDDGTAGIVPEEWLRNWAGIAGVGEASGDHVRFKVSQVALLDAALQSQPAVRVDERFARTRDELASFSGITALDAASSFAGQLRDYQRDALGWFAFLRRFGFGGCLADDMGLGKTVMVLAWLDRLRASREATGPSIVVVPRSVVFNWKEEAARFAPKLRVLDFSGSSRLPNRMAALAKHDVVLTSYGALRRDVLLFGDTTFEYAILDEAQTIKNANTAGAKAARLLKAKHRLALSGTPVENHLGELWSLFEFLNPGLLGTSSTFARHRGAASKQDRAAIDVLARGVRPFILRRTKAQVAPELPARNELTLHCDLQGIQRELYDELRNHYRTALRGRIAREGLQKSRMHILEALLRLRQAACHCGLIDARHKDVPSAKFDALLPHLAEVREEGHKALVFSQFTSLLGLLRTRLDEAGTPYAYLDGRTRDRQSVVHRFQTDPDCGVFLISLKAGGLGLNLTAAEYVFLLDPWWNPAVEAQAIDRAHRIGQTRHVFAYRLLATGTVEEKIAELQQSKRDLADAILQADAGLLRNLKQEDLEVLLS